MFIEDKLQRHLARSGVNKRNVLQFFIREFSSLISKHELKAHVRDLRSIQLQYLSVNESYSMDENEFLNAISQLSSFKTVYNDYVKLYRL